MRIQFIVEKNKWHVIPGEWIVLKSSTNSKETSGWVRIELILILSLLDHDYRCAMESMLLVLWYKTSGVLKSFTAFIQPIRVWRVTVKELWKIQINENVIFEWCASNEYSFQSFVLKVLTNHTFSFVLLTSNP